MKVYMKIKMQKQSGKDLKKETTWRLTLQVVKAYCGTSETMCH